MSPIRGLKRLIHATLVALAVVFSAPIVGAAVPMCSEDGRTVAAPPIARPGSDAVLRAPVDCERVRALLTNVPPLGDQRGGSIQAGDAPLRAVPVRAELPDPPLFERLVIDGAHTIQSAAVRDGVFRPPRAG